MEEGEETRAAKANSIGTQFVMQICENEAAFTDLHSHPPAPFLLSQTQTDMPTHMHDAAHMAHEATDLQDSPCAD